jgi:diphthamide biosynthesis methyltransferase
LWKTIEQKDTEVENETLPVLAYTCSTYTKAPTLNTSMNFNNMQTFKTQEQFYGRSLIIADRDLIEQGADEILQDAGSKDVALLVVGDPFGATTHTDLVLRAREANINCKIIHNASIMNAVGCCGLQVS